MKTPSTLQRTRLYALPKNPKKLSIEQTHSLRTKSHEIGFLDLSICSYLLLIADVLPWYSIIHAGKGVLSPGCWSFCNSSLGESWRRKKGGAKSSPRPDLVMDCSHRICKGAGIGLVHPHRWFICPYPANQWMLKKKESGFVMTKELTILGSEVSPNSTFLTMLFPALVRVVVGVVGNILCLSLFLSPLPTFLQICKKGSVAQYSAVPYIVTFLNCMIWVLYAIPIVHSNSTWLLTVNSAGCLIEFSYLLLFVIYSDSRKKRLQLISIVTLEIVAVGLLASLVLSLVHTTKLRIKIVGTIGLVTAIMMYASPLSVMKMVINTKSVEYMPLYLSLASFSNAAVWTVYGLAPFDPYVITPSGLGVVFGLAQLILYGVYFRSKKQKEVITSSKVEM